MYRLGTGLLLIAAVACPACRQDAAGPAAPQPADEAATPLEIRFLPSEGLGAKEGEASCGVPEGRDQIYDPGTGVFHVHFKTRDFTASTFEVTKATGRFVRPVVFRLTGVPAGHGCLGSSLALSVGGKTYVLDDGALAPGPVDGTLFRVARKGEVVTVEFTEPGQALLRPGARIGFSVDTGW
jgi:hypothetical protein